MSGRFRILIRAGAVVPLVAVVAFVAMGQVPPPNFGDPLPGLTTAQQARFNAGLDQFEEAESVEDGLGPVFNDVSCAACHSVGGVGGGSDIFVTRFGRTDHGRFDPLAQFGGSLIQKNGIGQFGAFNFVAEVVPPIANTVAKRRTVPLFGLGLVDAVPDRLFFAIAQRQQEQSPDTAGRVAIVTDVASGQQRVGKFGWKCQNATLLTFSGDAYLNEMGITTPMFPNENCPQGNCAMLAGNPALRNPNDVDNSALTALTDFMTLLGPPPPGPSNPSTRAGGQVFQAIGCANCHLPALVTGQSPIRALNNVAFQPFSDFLLHDMGNLGDGIVQSAASGSQMRTAPLWGLREFTTFLHDGRANSVTAAILAHDGQGGSARNRFRSLDPTRKAQLLAFLNSL
jgi:CxxC motif-containing protein (DUF1111 family)